MSRRIPCRTQRAPGFTLVEVLIVAVILGILAAIVVPKFASAGDEPTYEVARSFERALDYGYLESERYKLYSMDGSGKPARFNDFVSAGREIKDWRTDGGVSTVGVRKKLRSLLKDPGAYVITQDLVITLEFKTGLVATYTLDPTNGKITATYTGPGAP